MAQRSTLKKIHLYLAAFLLPFLFMMSLSGGLEIIGVKGHIDKQLIHTQETGSLDFKSPFIQQDLEILLEKIGVDTEIDHIKINKYAIYTRPTYTTYYGLKREGEYLKIYRYTPDIIKKLMVLHKGNGPEIYQFYQKLLVAGLLVVLSVGLWLGVASKKTRKQTVIIFLAGFGFYLITIL